MQEKSGHEKLNQRSRTINLRCSDDNNVSFSWLPILIVLSLFRQRGEIVPLTMIYFSSYVCCLFYTIIFTIPVSLVLISC